MNSVSYSSLAASHLSIWTKEFADRVSYLSRAGFPEVELALSAQSSVNSDTYFRWANRLGSRLREVGSRITGIHSLFFGEDSVLELGEKDLLAFAKDRVMLALRLCQELGGETVVFGSPKVRNALGPEGLVEMLHNIDDEASSQALKPSLLLEPLPLTDTSVYSTVRSLLQLMQDCDFVNVGFSVDVRALILNGDVGCMGDFPEMFPQLVHVNSVDFGLLSSSPMSRQVVNCLREAGYMGRWSLEAKNLGRGASKVLEDLKLLRSWVS